MKIQLQLPKVRDHVAKDLHTPKYHMRVVKSKKRYNRKEKHREFEPISENP